MSLQLENGDHPVSPKTARHVAEASRSG